MRFSAFCFRLGLAGIVGAAMIIGVSLLISLPDDYTRIAIASGSVGVLGLAWCIIASLFESIDDGRRTQEERERL